LKSRLIPISGDAESLNENSSSKMFAPDYNRWNGFYVFDLNSSDGFNLKGIITHSADDSRYYGMERYLKMNSFNDLEEINLIKLENTGKFIEYLEEEILR